MIYAKYTVVLKSIMDEPQGMEAITKAMSTYPLYEKKSKEEYIPSYVPTRSELNQKILNYYRYREIGFETVGRFLDELETALCEIMPKYNQLYFSADQDYNLLYNADYTRKIITQRDGQDSSDTTSETTSKNKNVASDTSTGETTNEDKSKHVQSLTPQNEIDIPASDIDNVPYADQVDWTKANTSGTTSTQGSSESESDYNSLGNVTAENIRKELENMQEEVKGNYGQVSYQYLIGKYRDLILNIDQMIIRDPRIQELFMMVY